MGSNRTRQVSLELRNDETVSYGKVPNKDKPPFYAIGNGFSRQGDRTANPIDFIHEITNMSKPEQFVIQTIKEAIGYFNLTIGEVHIPTSIFSPAEQQRWKKGMQVLKLKKLVGSRKKSHFMINPNALIPKEYKEALNIWNEEIYPPSPA